MHTLVAMATQVAHADVPVLITGPNGAGKEVLADIVQANSTRARRALPEGEPRAPCRTSSSRRSCSAPRPARSPARKARVGRFEAADGGTLFLDELGNLARRGQAKLLRVLQTGEFERLGSNTTRRTQVRVIAATNADLRAGHPRRPLPRGPVLPAERDRAEVPPLAERRDDILPLARHFLQPGNELTRGGGARAAAPHLAGQRARAAERDPPRLPAVDASPRSARPL